MFRFVRPSPRLRQRARNPRAAFLVLALGVASTAVLAADPSRAEIRVWVDDQGVTHFSDDPERAPDAATSVESDTAIETLRSVWNDGLVGPPIEGGRESSFGDDRVARLLRGAVEDLRRGEVARADSTLRGVVRLAPERPEAHWYLSGLARARGRFSTAEHHLRRFLDTAGPKLESWRVRARQRLAAIEDERRLADPEALDGPLELETIRGDHFRLQLDARLGDVSRDYAAEVMGYLREARADVSRSIGVEPLEPLGVVLYGRAAYVRAHAHRFSFQTIGFFDGRIHVASPAHPTESLRGVLFHEYTHAVFRDVTGGDRPYWLNEGLAEQIERASRGRAVSTRSERAALRANVEMGAWIPLASIADSFAGLDDDGARNAYLQSVVTVGYIHDNTSVEQRRRLLERIGDGFSVDQALHEVMGVDTAGIDAAVRAEIRREFPEWTLPADVPANP
ncbi:MAG: peptidase MA family metallohydrolase [bacterium]|nr:peptidase MA family metallohydrolase [bacterium]